MTVLKVTYNDSARVVPILLVLVALTMVVSLSSAAGNYGIPRFSMVGGGGTIRGGAYILSGTSGQCSANVISGGSYSLTGGFWPGDVQEIAVDRALYLPLIRKPPTQRADWDYRVR